MLFCRIRCRAARGIEKAELDTYGVRDFSHDATQGVDFANQVSFGDSAHGGVAGHLRDQVDVEGVERGLQAHAGGGHRGFASGVARAHHHDVELFGKLHQLSANGWEIPPV